MIVTGGSRNTCTITCNSYTGLSEVAYSKGNDCTNDDGCSGTDMCCGRIDTNTNRTGSESFTSAFSSVADRVGDFVGDLVGDPTYQCV